jgi:hypothetical protein
MNTCHTLALEWTHLPAWLGTVTYTHVMHKSKFSKVIKIRKNQLEWIKENKIWAGCKTDAGFLDIVINYFKKYEMPKLQQRNGSKDTQNVS